MAIAAERPAFNRISGPGAVRLPAPRLADLAVDLEWLDAYFEALDGESPQVRARKLTELLEGVTRMVRVERRRALLELQANGMTYREIAAAVGISFGRVRQILANKEAESLAA